VREHKRIKSLRELTPEMQTQAGAFASLHLPAGELRPSHARGGSSVAPR
jgi:hypothetical protein